MAKKTRVTPDKVIIMGKRISSIFLFAIWAGVVLWLAIPRHDICFAILPAGAGCKLTDRVPIAVGSSITMALLLVVVWILTSQYRHSRAVTLSLIGGYALAALISYRVVLYG